MKANHVAMAVFLFAMILGSPVDARNSTFVTAADSKPLHASKLSLIFCAQTKCDYFSSPRFLICYCCPDKSKREYCHLTMEECRANCASCTPKC